MPKSESKPEPTIPTMITFSEESGLLYENMLAAGE